MYVGAGNHDAAAGARHDDLRGLLALQLLELLDGSLDAGAITFLVLGAIRRVLPRAAERLADGRRQ